MQYRVLINIQETLLEDTKWEEPVLKNYFAEKAPTLPEKVHICIKQSQTPK